MADFLDRGHAPLTAEQWKELDERVSRTAESALVGRRFIEVSGPWGPGVQAIPTDMFEGTDRGSVDLLGEAAGERIYAARRSHLSLPLIYKDFQFNWRDIETSQQLGTPLDFGPAVQAARYCAHAEDQLIFRGNEALGYEGLLTVEGRQSMPLADWSATGAAFDQVVAAIAKLTDEGFYGDYAFVTNPQRFAQLNRVHAATGVLELEQIQKLCRAGVFRTSVLEPDESILVAVGADNMDLALAFDLVTAYLNTENMNHHFRVLESIALRIKRPGSIVCLEG